MKAKFKKVGCFYRYLGGGVAGAPCSAGLTVFSARRAQSHVFIRRAEVVILPNEEVALPRDSIVGGARLDVARFGSKCLDVILAVSERLAGAAWEGGGGGDGVRFYLNHGASLSDHEWEALGYKSINGGRDGALICQEEPEAALVFSYSREWPGMVSESGAALFFNGKVWVDAVRFVDPLACDDFLPGAGTFEPGTSLRYVSRRLKLAVFLGDSLPPVMGVEGAMHQDSVIVEVGCESEIPCGVSFLWSGRRMTMSANPPEEFISEVEVKNPSEVPETDWLRVYARDIGPLPGRFLHRNTDVCVHESLSAHKIELRASAFLGRIYVHAAAKSSREYLEQFFRDRAKQFELGYFVHWPDDALPKALADKIVGPLGLLVECPLRRGKFFTPFTLKELLGMDRGLAVLLETLPAEVRPLFLALAADDEMRNQVLIEMMTSK